MDPVNTDFLKKQLTRYYFIIEKSVKQRFPHDPEMLDEALSFVSEKLVEDNMRRLSLYDPERGATFKTYFTVLVQRLISRFIGQNKKQRRLPKWIREQANFLWQAAYKLLCWEHRPDPDALDYLKHSVPGIRDENVVREAILVIRETYPDCGKDSILETSLNTDILVSDSNIDPTPSFHHLSPEDQMAYNQVLSLADTIFMDPDTVDASSPAPSGDIASLKRRLNEKFNPSPDKRLFLKMIYHDGMNVSEAGRLLGWNANQASGHHRRLMALLEEIIGDDILI